MLSRRWYRPGLIPIIAVIILMGAAVACGEDATPTSQPPQPAPTTDVASIEDAVSRAVQTALSGAASAVTAEEIQEMVQSAVSGIPSTGLSAEDIQSLVAMAVTDAIPEGATAEDIQAMVMAAVTAAAQPGLSEEQIAALVAETVMDSGLSAEDVEKIVKAAIPPTPTPMPTATPVPTPMATPTPGFMTAMASRIIVATGPPTQETSVSFQTLTGRGHLHAMYEALFGGDRSNGTYTPELAKQWEASADATTWKIWLQEGVEFHHGYGEFTAKDVVHSWERTTGEGFSADAGSWIRLVENASDFEIIDDHTIVFNLTKPELDFVFYGSTRNGTMFMISKDQWDLVGIEGLRIKPAGTGPWVLRDWSKGASMLYDRVENHWRKTPEFREAEIRWVREEATRLASLLVGEITMTDLSRDVQKRAIERGMGRSIGSEPQSALQGYWMGLWCEGLYCDESTRPDTPFQDKRVRAAMLMAVDRVELNDTLFDGRGEISSVSYSYRSFPSYDPGWDERAQDIYRYDPVAAMALLTEAGYPDGFDVTLLDIPWTGWPEYVPMVEATSLYWEAIGLNVKIEGIEYNRVREKMRNKDKDWAEDNVFFYFPPWFMSPRPFQVSYSYYSGDDGVLAVFTDERIDTAYEELAVTTDLDRRYELERAIDEVVFADFGDLTLFYIPNEVVFDSNVVSVYNFPGVYTDPYTELEYAQAAAHQ